MKYFYSIILAGAVLYSGSVYSQGSDSAAGKRGYFEGVITYDVLVESKLPLVSSADMQEMYGRTMRLYIGEIAYKLVFEGDSAIEVLYRSDDNRQYLKLGTRDSILWRTAENYDSKFIATRSATKTAIVLGRYCDAYTIETDWGAVTYFYHHDIKMNPKPFRGHGFNYFNVYLQHSKAPYLKYLYDGPSMKMTLTARDIEWKRHEDGTFLPESLPLASIDLLPDVCNLKQR